MTYNGVRRTVIINFIKKSRLSAVSFFFSKSLIYTNIKIKIRNQTFFSIANDANKLNDEDYKLMRDESKSFGSTANYAKIFDFKELIYFYRFPLKFVGETSKK